MTLAALPGSPFIYPPNTASIRASLNPGEFAVTTATLDAADEAVAITMMAHKTGSIDRIKFRTATVTTGVTLNCAIETIATGGIPNFTKTLWGANTEVGKVVADTDDNVWLEATLTSAASVTAGDVFAVTLRQPSSSPGNLQIRTMWSSSQSALISAGVTTYSSTALGAPPTAFAITSDRIAISVRYSTGEWYHGLFGALWAEKDSVTNINTGTATTRAGNRFKLPFSAEFRGGLFLASNLAANSAGNIVLRDDSWNSLASGAWDGDYIRGTSYEDWFPALVSSPYTLSANTWYRITVEPTTANNISVLGCDFADADIQSANSGGVNFYKTLYTSGAGDDSATLKMLGVFPLLSALDDGAGGGGVIGANMRGGFING